MHRYAVLSAVAGLAAVFGWCLAFLGIGHLADAFLDGSRPTVGTAVLTVSGPVLAAA